MQIEKAVRGNDRNKIPDFPKFYRQAAEVFGNYDSIEDMKIVIADVRAGMDHEMYLVIVSYLSLCN